MMSEDLRKTRVKDLPDSVCPSQIKPLFYEFLVEDVLRVEPDDLVDDAMPKDKLVVSIFLRKLHLLAGTEEGLERPGATGSPFFSERPLSGARQANWTNRLTPKLFASGPYCLTVADVRATLAGKVPTPVDVLLLGSNSLLDEDLPDVVSLIESLGPCPEIVDLSFNRFQGLLAETQPRPSVDDQIQTILDMPGLKYLVITGNPVVSKNRKGFIACLAETHLRKLIWVPKTCLGSKSWRDVIDSDLVYEAHREFYGKAR